MPPDELRHAVFTQLLHDVFTVIDDRELPVAVTLDEVSDCTATPHHESFSLVFIGPKDQFIGQGIHKLTNPKTGEIDIFWVPISLAEAGYRYEAVFNRLID